MKPSILLASIFFFVNSSFAFDADLVTKQFELVLNEGDSTKFSNYFDEAVILYQVKDDCVKPLSLLNFYPVLKKFKAKEYQEEFKKIDVKNLGTGLIYVDVSFDFYINETYSHSGIDHVIWSKQSDGSHKIISLYSGALKPSFTNSHGEDALLINLSDKMNKWHNDVATFNYSAYFDFMSDDFIFLGTDPSERWSKEEFAGFCKPYFDKKSTWDFKTNWRNWYLNESKDIAWFEESLDTWMEECRGSGVVKKVNGQWKIAHYNLTVLIENEKMDKFLKLRKK